MKHLRERNDEEGVQDSKVIQAVQRMAEIADKRDRVLLNNEEERKVFEEVFDRKTLFVLYSLMNKGAFSYLNGVVSSGKESRVYWGVKNSGENVAVKVYLVASSDFKRRLRYVEGDPRFKKIRRDSRGMAETWARKEFTNLKQAYDAGVRVPKPESFEGNVLVMEFIGDSNGLRAPLILETEVKKKDYLEIMKSVKTLYSKADLVHADLSEYNVFKYQGKNILFDFGSAVSVNHPSSEEFLKRDIQNINNFFQKRSVRVFEEQKILSHIIKNKGSGSSEAV
jgi:RIO kinase 1